jgi:hypothetical protein
MRLRHRQPSRQGGIACVWAVSSIGWFHVAQKADSVKGLV